MLYYYNAITTGQLPHLGEWRELSEAGSGDWRFPHLGSSTLHLGITGASASLHSLQRLYRFLVLPPPPSLATLSLPPLWSPLPFLPLSLPLTPRLSTSLTCFSSPHSLHTHADIYGSSETLVGQFLRLNPELRSRVQLLTKLTVAEEDMGRLSRDMVEYVSRGG